MLRVTDSFYSATKMMALCLWIPPTSAANSFIFVTYTGQRADEREEFFDGDFRVFVAVQVLHQLLQAITVLCFLHRRGATIKNAADFYHITLNVTKSQ